MFFFLLSQFFFVVYASVRVRFYDTDRFFFFLCFVKSGKLILLVSNSVFWKILISFRLFIFHYLLLFSSFSVFQFFRKFNLKMGGDRMKGLMEMTKEVLEPFFLDTVGLFLQACKFFIVSYFLITLLYFYLVEKFVYVRK